MSRGLRGDKTDQDSNMSARHFVKKGKQKSPGTATSRSRSQPPKQEGREKVTQINVRITNKQMHNKHIDQLPLPLAR